jgi:hypothetical protein
MTSIVVTPVNPDDAWRVVQARHEASRRLFEKMMDNIAKTEQHFEIVLKG